MDDIADPGTAEPRVEPDPAREPPGSASRDPERIVLEALQIAYASTGAEAYRGVYEQLRQLREQRRGSEGRADPSESLPPLPPLAQAVRAAAGSTPAHSAAMPVPERIRLVCATRADREGFFSSAALGRSLTVHRPAAVELRLFPRNTRGLPAVYNTAIAEAADDDVVLLFIHDDLHLCDYHWADRLREGLGQFDVVGLAGNRRRLPRQTGWAFSGEKMTPDTRDHMSGTVGHGTGYPPETVDVFGPTRQSVKVLDGLFLAARSTTLRAKSLRFDERFDFHFYDLDFCRQAEQAGLTMGTWPISVVHESHGGYASEGWQRGYGAYIAKWQD